MLRNYDQIQGLISWKRCFGFQLEEGRSPGRGLVATAIDLTHVRLKAQTLVRYLSTSQDVACQLYFCKVALADGFEKPVVADVWMLVW